MQETVSPKKTIITPAAGPVRAAVTVPGDKSISHRSVMLGALAEGRTEIRGFLDSADCRSTIGCFRALGVEVEESDGTVIVTGRGIKGLEAPADTLDVGNSGTTMRLMTGMWRMSSDWI